MNVLDRTAPPQFAVTHDVEIKLGEKLRYIPDVLVVTAEAFGDGNRARFQPHQVVLAVEIVSESSRGMDRILKPAHYAAAGIPQYWRIELDDAPLVDCYELGLNGEYVLTGSHRTTLAVSAPWPISVELADLVR